MHGAHNERCIQDPLATRGSGGVYGLSYDTSALGKERMPHGSEAMETLEVNIT
jgi:hypothetical protein